jgi:hypothetical protein
MIGHPAPFTGEFEQVIMIAVGIEEMAGSDRVPTLTIESEPQVGKAQTIYESEMALHFECTHSCARIGLDTADIVRDRDFSPTGSETIVQVLFAE